MFSVVSVCCSVLCLFGCMVVGNSCWIVSFCVSSSVLDVVMGWLGMMLCFF